MALHGAERDAERARDYSRTEMMLLQARCADLEDRLRDMQHRLVVLERFVSSLLPPS